jgi:mono/diheme cytochrome c family protein
LLGVTLFIAFWVLLAAGVFFFAGRRPANERREKAFTYRGSRGLAVTMVVIYVGFGVAVPLLFLSGNHRNSNKQVNGIKLTAAEQHGRGVFSFRCGFCHTLAAANAVGKVGPNLDKLRPPASLVLNTINNGCLPNPPAGSPQQCLGNGVMPAQIIQGQDAADVAAFVARVTSVPTLAAH